MTKQDTHKSREELLAEVVRLRQHVAALEEAQSHGGGDAPSTDSWGDEALFRALTDNAQDSIFCKDTDLRYTFANPAMARLFGCQIEDLIGRAPTELFSPEDAASIAEADGPVLRGEVTDLVRSLEVAGKEHVFHTVQVPVFDDDGDVHAICGIVRDITDREQSRAALDESESVLRSFYDNSTMMMGVLERVKDDVAFVSLNASFAGFLGLVDTEAADALLSGLPDHRFARDLWVQRLHESERLGQPIQFEYEHRSSGEAQWLLAFVSPISRQTGDHPRFSCVVTDITERKVKEVEHSELEEQLRQSLKMDAVGRLAGGVAHDFNNLLTAILGFTDVLSEHLVDNEAALEDLDEIRRAGETAASLTQQLLAFSRRQMISPRNLVLNGIVDHSSRMLRRIIGENLKLAFTPDPSLWEICIDPAQMDQVLVNLTVNARDAMPQAGVLTLRTQNVTADQRTCSGCGEHFSGEHVLLEITDTGEGMSSDTLSRVFEPFFTTKGKGKGTGLGLATVHGITHQNHGHQVVTSALGEGTIFQLFFPRAQGAEHERPDSGQLPHMGGGETVLVAEDQDFVLRLVVRKLEESGYNVIAAKDGKEALRCAEALDAPADLLVTDVVMPHFNGKQLYDKLIQLWPQMRVLYMSGYSGDAIAQHGVIDPDVAFLQKPFKVRALLRMVRETLETPAPSE